MLIGYARVSTDDQNLDLQRDALDKAGCDRVFTDTESGAKANRPGLDEALSHLREGDTLVVWRLDRLGRSVRQVVTLVEDLDARGVQFQSLKDGIDTTTANGKFFFHVIAAFGQLERDIIRERTNAGLAAARSRGRVGGRPRVLDEKKRQQAVTLHKDPSNSISNICHTLKISRATLYRYLGNTHEIAELGHQA